MAINEDVKSCFEGITLNEKYNYQKITYKIDDETVYIIKIVLNNDIDKPVLFTIPGLSHRSFLGTSNIIISKLDVLATKFKEIYLLEYESFTDDMKTAFIDQQKKINEVVGGEEKFEEMTLDEKLKENFFDSVCTTNTAIATLTKRFINAFELSNIHLLGKCNGGFVATILITQCKDTDKIKGLYLAVPGSPFSVKKLEVMGSDKLQEIKFIFAWTKQDDYLYKWGVKSCEEKVRYDIIMNNFENINYESFMYNNGQESHPSNFHEIYPDMIDAIIKSI